MCTGTHVWIQWYHRCFKVESLQNVSNLSIKNADAIHLQHYLCGFIFSKNEATFFASFSGTALFCLHKNAYSQLGLCLWLFDSTTRYFQEHICIFETTFLFFFLVLHSWPLTVNRCLHAYCSSDACQQKLKI